MEENNNAAPMPSSEPTPVSSPVTSSGSSDWKGMLHKLEEMFDDYLHKKAPALPEDVKKAIVEFAPWIILVIVALSVVGVAFAVLGAGFAGAVAVSTGYGAVYGVGALQLILYVVLLLPIIVLEGWAVPGLMKKSKSKGWNFVYYSQLLNVVYNVLSLNVFGVVFSIVGFYILFQVRDRYTN